MSAATYLSTDIEARLRDAQPAIDMHLALSRRGVCGLCEQPEPCHRRDAAQALFTRYGKLPRRTPGLTLATASRLSSVRWLDETTARRIAEGVEDPPS